MRLSLQQKRKWYNADMPAGAPSKITPELLAKAKAFVEGGWQSVKNGSFQPSIPTIEALALELGLYRSYLYAVPELSDMLEQIQAQQSMMVLNKGLTGEFNSNIAKLLLSSKHGYVEKSASEQTVVADVTSNGETVGKSTVDDLINVLKDKTAKEAQ